MTSERIERLRDMAKLYMRDEDTTAAGHKLMECLDEIERLRSEVENRQKHFNSKFLDWEKAYEAVIGQFHHAVEERVILENKLDPMEKALQAVKHYFDGLYLFHQEGSFRTVEGRRVANDGKIDDLCDKAFEAVKAALPKQTEKPWV